MQHGASQRKEIRLNMRGLQPRASRCNARPITRNEQVSGSSPLVGSLFLPIDKPNTREEETLGDLPGASLHHPYITEAGVKLTHKLLPRNAFDNASETVVL